MNANLTTFKPCFNERNMYVKKNRTAENKHKNMYWLLGKRFQLSIENKELVYQQVLNRYAHNVCNCGAVPKKAILMWTVKEEIKKITRSFEKEAS